MGCKHCHSENFYKSDFTRGKQRYKCKDCGRHFVIGDDRTNDKIIGTKALCVVLYSLAKASYAMLGKIFDRDRSQIYRCPEK
jgi:transposase